MRIVSLPSYQFADWILREPENLERFSHLADLFLTHYEQNKNSTDSFTRAVVDWLQQQKETVPGRWLEKDANRAARLQEYGRLQKEAAAHNLSLAKKQEYVEVRADRYPGLNFKLPTTTELLTVSKPAGIELDVASQDMMYYRAVDYQYSAWGSPYRGTLISVPIPIDKQ
jgi:hypothetical protein